MEDGVIGLFNWDDWGDIKDRFPGHKASVDTMCKVDEKTVCTGSMDGQIRFDYAAIHIVLVHL
jgi:hypothetical protein